jgi:hypothetical protein
MFQTAILEIMMYVLSIQMEVLVVVQCIVALERYHQKPAEALGLKPVLLDGLPHLRNLFIAAQTVIRW